MCPFLIKGPCPRTGTAKLEPTDRGTRGASTTSDREVAHHRLVRTKVAIGESPHRPLTDLIDLLGRVLLRYAIEVEVPTRGVSERSDRQRCSEGKRTIGGRHPVDVKVIHLDTVSTAVLGIVLEGVEVIRFTCIRRVRTIKIAR